MVVNYLAGEGVIHLDEGRPLVLRRPDSRFTLANFLRAQLYSTMATLKIGMDLLASEQVAIDSLTGHGGLFKTPGVGPEIYGRGLRCARDRHGERRRRRPLRHGASGGLRPAGRRRDA